MVSTDNIIDRNVCCIMHNSMSLWGQNVRWAIIWEWIICSFSFFSILIQINPSNLFKKQYTTCVSHIHLTFFYETQKEKFCEKEHSFPVSLSHKYVQRDASLLTSCCFPWKKLSHTCCTWCWLSLLTKGGLNPILSFLL